MFSTTHIFKSRKHLLAAADAVVEFSTLGEYRVMIEGAEAAENVVGLWDEPIEWSSPVRAARPECTLPRVHDRGKALALAH